MPYCKEVQPELLIHGRRSFRILPEPIAPNEGEPRLSMLNRQGAPCATCFWHNVVAYTQISTQRCKQQQEGTRNQVDVVSSGCDRAGSDIVSKGLTGVKQRVESEGGVAWSVESGGELGSERSRLEEEWWSGVAEWSLESRQS